MAFLFDTNVLIEAKNRYYGFDICPGFWDWLAREQEGDRVISVAAVRDELIGREDELSEWVRDRARFFLAPDEQSLRPMATLAEWVRRQNYRPAAIAEFLDSADYYLIAYAMAHGHTLVSHERPSDAVRRVKIPEPCIAHGVEIINPFVMLRRSKCRFVLSS